MKKIILTLATVACMTLPMQAQAFDITGIVKNAVTNAVTGVVEETTTEVTNEVTKTAVKETGIKGLTPSTKALNADGITNIAKSNGLAVTPDILGKVEPSSGQVSTNENSATSNSFKELKSNGTSAPITQKGNAVSGILKGIFNSQ